MLGTVGTFAAVVALTVVGAPSAEAATSCTNVSRVYNTNGTRYANVPSIGANTFSFNCQLNRGNNSTAVRALQTTLNRCYSAGLTVDGDFGGNTEEA